MKIVNASSGWDDISTPAPAGAGGWDDISIPERRTAQRRGTRDAAADAAADAEKYRPDAGMSGTEKFLVGAGSSLDKAWRGVTGLLGADTSQGKADAEVYQKHRPEGWQTTAGEITGDVAAQLPLAAVPGGALAQIASAGLGSAVTTPGDWKERGTAGLVGAGGAAAGQGLAKTLGRLGKPVGDKADDILALEAKGVQPTFGQSMGASDSTVGKALGRLEESAQSIPLGGSRIREAREAGLGQWRQMTRDAALPPGATKGAKTVNEVIDATSKAYDDVLMKHRLPYASVTYQPDMRKLTAGIAIDKDARAMVEDTFQQLRLNHMQNPTPGAQVTAVGAQQVESALKKKAFNFMNSQDPSQREIGQAFKKLAEEYGQTWRNALPRDDMARIKLIDRGYPKRLALQKAATQTGIKASHGIPDNFSPVSLVQASRSTDRIPGKRSYLGGAAPLQEQGRLGLRLTPEVGDSGTPERAVSMAILSGLSGLGDIATLGGGSALYASKPIQQWLTGRAAPKTQDAILKAMRRAAPYAGAAGAGTADDLLEDQQNAP